MKYAPHPWDKYGDPNLEPDDDGINREELEERMEELRDWIEGKEREIEDLEDELREAESELYELEQRIDHPTRPKVPGQSFYSEEL